MMSQVKCMWGRLCRSFPTFGMTAAVLIFILNMAGGCGYQVGFIGHPQIHSVGIAPVVNETVEYNVASEVRSLLCERFMVDGTLKLVDVKEADCIVYARVVGVKFSEVSWSDTDDDDDVYLPNEWSVTLKIEYSVIIPGRNEPLLAKRTASGSAYFQTGPDMEIGRRNGIRQAAYAAAKNVVSGVTEGW